jgi:hypothetical protein
MLDGNEIEKDIAILQEKMRAMIHNSRLISIEEKG